jgi:hypothetical protein
MYIIDYQSLIIYIMKHYQRLFCMGCAAMLVSFSTAEAQTVKKSAATSPTNSGLNGGWQRVYVLVNGKKEPSAQRPEFRVYHDGFFAIIGQDSAGAWVQTHGGTYELNGNLYKEHIKYSSFPARNGMVHWQEFKVNGDTVTFTLFNKILRPNGQNITADMPKMKMVCVRARR